MPRLNDVTMDELGQTTGAYSFSGVRIEELGATEYTLATIMVDASYSVEEFQSEMEKAIQEAIRACQLSPRADNLMLRLVKFNRQMEEVHGFKLLNNINLDDYKGILQCRGSTMLYDTIINATEAVTSYAKTLSTAAEIDVNAINILITDGMDNESSYGPDTVATKIKEALHSETLESLVSLLVGVNITDKVVSDFLKQLQTHGFDKYIELDNASQKTLARLGGFISQSISAQSQSLGTGGPSQSLPSF